MKGKLRHWKVGSYEDNAYRKRPNPQNVNNFMDEMGPTMSDYDVYLWGSWPEKKSTWDLDLLLKNGNSNLDSEEMENIVLKGLNSSLKNNNFLADIGFTNRKVTPFKQHMDKFRKTGKGTIHDGYVYGPQWYVDNKLYKDRTKFNNGTVIPMDNNMLHVISQMPYSKMKSGNNYDKYYKNKPLLIKPRKKIYGI